MTKECGLIFNSKGIIFDLDGTLIDSVDSHVTSWIISFDKVMKRKTDPKEIRKLIGLSGKDIVKRLFGREGINRYKEIRWVKDRTFLNEIRTEKVRLFPGSLKLLKELKSNGKLIGIATSTPIYMAIHILEYFNIIKYADAIVCGDEVNKGKPNPEIFIKCIRRLDISPTETTVVGDTLYDILPALSINARATLVNANHSILLDLSVNGSFMTFSNICSLLDCMKRTSNR